ncbi:putative bifunctional diguanylate cyclase/phosphodiesterase [Parasedimentitalea huanghaiensis]|uniref:putative bifunctional diguanylate cyclase/phosphodiesterase n=1 Tax=Parasedimentitalea huanghaiensis TaxID=2682100 RepID=UPI00143199B5|nr:EAL domain-containing protein [Zongyanglinia huanghaiensis]
MYKLLKGLKAHTTAIIITLTTLLTFSISAEYELLEAFYEASRAHEDWELDELAILVLNLTVGLIWFLIVRSRQLSRAVKERDKAEKAAQKIARHDALTGLANRRAFSDHIENLKLSETTTEKSIMVMMLDLDRFKAVNDLHGHASGDYVLTETAKRITDVMGDGDFAARLGGDEFAITLAPGSTVERAERIARRLLTAIAKPVNNEGTKIPLGASIGVSRIVLGQGVSIALQLADQALYTAKKAGRGQFAWYNVEMDESAKERQQLEQDLRLTVRNEAIIPYFQPVFCMATGKLCGFEALARWRHPDKGMISPEIFIEIAEDIGLISQLGWSMLEQACKSAGEWDPSLKLAVNFSPVQFRDPNLVVMVRKILRETGFDPQRLEIEITETAIVLDFDLAKRSIEQLRELGVSLALDDFGTGFSSLSNLRLLPFDRLKIDRSFVTGIYSCPENQKIVAGILALANELELTVTAEGVENLQDHQFLMSMEYQCQQAQGYHYAKPLPGDEIDRQLETKWSNLHRNSDQDGVEPAPFAKFA